MVANAGGIHSLLYVISCREKFSASYAVVTLGNIAAMSPWLATAIIQAKV